MVEIKEKERAIIEFTCIPDVSIEKAQKLYDVGFKHLREFLLFTLDKDAKKKGLVDILNYKILSQFITVAQEDIPTNKFKCPLCMAIVYADEEECSECGALLLEEILDIEMEEVFEGLKEMIDTLIATPDSAEKFLSGLKEGEDSEAIEEIAITTRKLGKEAGVERGFVVTQIASQEEDNNHLIVLLPLGEHEKEREQVIKDLNNLGADLGTNYFIEGGNIVNKQEEAVSDVVSKFILDKNFELPGTKNLFILNLKIANFMESQTTLIIEDNRPFLSSLDDVDSGHEKIGIIEQMLHDAQLVREARKLPDMFILDGISFNNDPISFLIAQKSIPILTENPNVSIRLLDAVLNIDSIERGTHNDLVNLLLKWKS
jgi:hypothetical protein